MKMKGFLAEHIVVESLLIIVCSVIAGLAIYAFSTFIGGGSADARTFAFLPASLTVAITAHSLSGTLGGKR